MRTETVGTSGISISSPSPSGRGGGEGGVRPLGAPSNGSGPHPYPLPEGEGTNALVPAQRACHQLPRLQRQWAVPQRIRGVLARDRDVAVLERGPAPLTALLLARRGPPGVERPRLGHLEPAALEGAF